MFKYQFKSGKYFAGLIKSAELFLKSRFEGLEEFGLYALRTSHRLVCSATNHHCSQRKHRSSGVFYRFAPAWVQVPKIHTIKNLRIRRFFMVPTEGLGEFGLYASRTSHRLVCSATNHHRSQRKHRSSGVFYRFAPAWVQVPKIYTIKKTSV